MQKVNIEKNETIVAVKRRVNGCVSSFWSEIVVERLTALVKLCL